MSRQNAAATATAAAATAATATAAAHACELVEKKEGEGTFLGSALDLGAHDSFKGFDELLFTIHNTCIDALTKNCHFSSGFL